MLLKYLNDLDDAVTLAKVQPDQAHIGRCFECVDVLEDYLEDQLEPVRAKGREIMYRLWPQAMQSTTGRVALR